MTSYYDTPTVFDAPLLHGGVWPEHGAAATDNIWEPLIDGGSASAAPYGAVTAAWAASPLDAPANNPWSPTDQPFPSPLSEAPSFALSWSPAAEDGLSTGRASPALGPKPLNHLTTSRPASPLKPKDNLKPTKKPTHPPKPLASGSKRPATPKPPRPRTLKRHKSDTPSIASTGTDRGSTTSSLTSTTTTLGGVLPANIDPRVAAEQIRREAWERCAAEAREMSQRRSMLLDHERGALERETQRLQVNLGLMREAVKREREGWEEEGERGERAGRWVEGGEGGDDGGGKGV